MEALCIKARRDYYNLKDVSPTMTVQELIDTLRTFHPASPVVISNDGGYTYGELTFSCFYTRKITKESEEEKE